MLEAGGEPSQDNPGCKSLLSSSTRAPKARRTMTTFFWFFASPWQGPLKGPERKDIHQTFSPLSLQGSLAFKTLLFFFFSLTPSPSLAVLRLFPPVDVRTYVHRQGLACTIVTWDRRSSTGDCRPNRCCELGDFAALSRLTFYSPKPSIRSVLPPIRSLLLL